MGDQCSGITATGQAVINGFVHLAAVHAMRTVGQDELIAW